MARTQFGIIADHLGIPGDERARLLHPKRAIAVSVPVHMDDGRTEAFQGCRVQHHLTLGPTKGGTRFAGNLEVGEMAALAIWMSWKCALVGLPYGRASAVWGEGTTACAADSKQFGAWDQNLMAEWHARHGGRGTIASWTML